MSASCVSNVRAALAASTATSGRASSAAPAAPRFDRVGARETRRRRNSNSSHSSSTRVAKNPNYVPDPKRFDMEPNTPRTREEEEYQEGFRQDREWMRYDPDAVPEHAPAPWQVNTARLLDFENNPGAWPPWVTRECEKQGIDVHLHDEPEPEYIPYEETPGLYNRFDDMALQYRERVKAERAAATAKRAEEIRRTSWMSMEGDVRLKDIPSCDESAWTHEKIEELINFPPDVAARMEAHSVLRYDPRWPCDNTWIPPPEPDTWEFLKEIGRGSEDPLEDEALGEKLAMRNGITQRYEVELEAEEFLARSSEAQLQRAIDIGEDDDEDEEEEER